MDFLQLLIKILGMSVNKYVPPSKETQKKYYLGLVNINWIVRTFIVQLRQLYCKINLKLNDK